MDYFTLAETCYFALSLSLVVSCTVITAVFPDTNFHCHLYAAQCYFNDTDFNMLILQLSLTVCILSLVVFTIIKMKWFILSYFYRAFAILKDTIIGGSASHVITISGSVKQIKRLGSIFLLYATACNLITCSVAMSTVTITSPPMSINATLASDHVVMSCTAANADLVLFLVKGENADFVNHFDQGPVSINDTLISRDLIVQVSLDIDNTTVVCLAFIFQGNQSVTSESAIILVQGPLDPPGNPGYVILNRSSINISWTPPPTLLGTVINGYNISTSSGEYIFTNESFVLLTMTDPNPCTEINITISAYNGVDGRPATINGIYLPSSKIANDSSIVTFYRPSVDKANSEGKVKISLYVDVSLLCPGEIPTQLFVLVNNNFAANFSLVPYCDNSLQVTSGLIELIENQEYLIYITFGNTVTQDYGITSYVFINYRPILLSSTAVMSLSLSPVISETTESTVVVQQDTLWLILFSLVLSFILMFIWICLICYIFCKKISRLKTRKKQTKALQEISLTDVHKHAVKLIEYVNEKTPDETEHSIEKHSYEKYSDEKKSDKTNYLADYDIKPSDETEHEEKHSDEKNADETVADQAEEKHSDENLSDQKCSDDKNADETDHSEEKYSGEKHSEGKLAEEKGSDDKNALYETEHHSEEKRPNANGAKEKSLRTFKSFISLVSPQHFNRETKSAPDRQLLLSDSDEDYADTPETPQQEDVKGRQFAVSHTKQPLFQNTTDVSKD